MHEGHKGEDQVLDDLIQEATENLKKGDYNSAIEYSDEAIKINPRLALAYNIKGLALFNLRQYQEALTCYEKALELKPNYIEALNNKGLALAAIGKYGEAIESFNIAIEINPTYTEAVKNKELSITNIREQQQAINKALDETKNMIRRTTDEAIKFKIFCSECGQQLTTGTEKFCPNCGQGLMKGGLRGREATSETEENRSGINISETHGDVIGTGFSDSGNVIGKNIVVGSGTINVSQQELTKIQDPEYARALKDFSENINEQLKGRQTPEEQVKSINTSLEELAKEVQDVKPGREEQMDYPKQVNIESKTVSVVQKILSGLPEAETGATFTPLAPFSKLIGKGVQGIVDAIGKNVKTQADVATASKSTVKAQLASKTETTMEKYPYATFPNEIVIGDIAPLMIIIKAVQQTLVKDAPIAQETSKIVITASSDEKEVPVRVYVEQDNFEVVGGIYYKTILVPTRAEDSKPVIFDLKAKKEGKQDITIQFFQQGTYVGELKVNTTVLSKVPLYSSTVQQHSAASQTTQMTWNISKIPPRPDIMLYIYEKKRYPEYEYEIWLNSSEYENYPIGSKTLTHEAESRIRAMFDDIENRTLPADIFDDRMKSKGKSLYKELFPDKLKRFYWQNRDRIKSFQVITKDPWIPWEIIKPWDMDTDHEDPFLCERYAFSRWAAGKKTVIPNEQLKKVLVVVPSSTDLTNSIEERNWIEQFGNSIGAEVIRDSKYRHVVSSLKEGEFDMLHFSTHGKYNKDDPLFSQIELEDGLYLRPEDIGENAVKFRQAKPLVILNTCQSGVQGFSLTEIKSWATQFLDAGASAFIGTLWRVSDKAAFKFTQELYKQLSAGTVLGQAVQKARIICKEPGDSSWLAYELYGQPNSHIKLGFT
jgi:tetratricopeptide (TPR) repeat protein